jgi:hypothetical protein
MAEIRSQQQTFKADGGHVLAREVRTGASAHDKGAADHGLRHTIGRCSGLRLRGCPTNRLSALRLGEGK